MGAAPFPHALGHAFLRHFQQHQKQAAGERKAAHLVHGPVAYADREQHHVSVDYMMRPSISVASPPRLGCVRAGEQEAQPQDVAPSNVVDARSLTE